MRRGFVIVSLVAGSAVLFGARRPEPVYSTRMAEVVRLRSHFDSVDIELKSRDVSGLTESQRARRARLTSWLRDYRNTGVFPKNDKFDYAVPFFRDTDGTLCAMAYLIERSGRKDIVDKVARTRNNAYIRELVDDPALVAWLDSSGLSAAEAGRIQPSYNGGGGVFDDTRDNVDGDFALEALGLGSVSLATAALNVARPSYMSGALGVVFGAASIIVAADHMGRMDQTRGTDRLANATGALGAVSIGAGIYGILEARRHERERDRWGSPRRRKHSMVISPDVAIQQNAPRVGLLVHGTFR